MLASTVQFSTNNQPTTLTPPTNTGNNVPAGMGDQVIPGVETTTGSPSGPRPAGLHRSGPSRPASRAPGGPGCSFRYPTGCSLVRRPQPHQPTVPPPTPSRELPSEEGMCVLSVPAVAGIQLASVSAFEHPDLTFAGRGLLDRFPGQGAP
jgi:hypothetical protein